MVGQQILFCGSTLLLPFSPFENQEEELSGLIDCLELKASRTSFDRFINRSVLNIRSYLSGGSGPIALIDASAPKNFAETLQTLLQVSTLGN